MCTCFQAKCFQYRFRICPRHWWWWWCKMDCLSLSCVINEYIYIFNGLLSATRVLCCLCILPLIWVWAGPWVTSFCLLHPRSQRVMTSNSHLLLCRAMKSGISWKLCATMAATTTTIVAVPLTPTDNFIYSLQLSSVHVDIIIFDVVHCAHISLSPSLDTTLSNIMYSAFESMSIGLSVYPTDIPFDGKLSV